MLGSFLVRLRAGRFVISSLVIGVLLLVAFTPGVAHAAVGGLQGALGEILAGIIATVTWFVGQLLLLVIYVLTQVAQYNDFVTSPAVSTGWVIVRDVANMFFIVVLLIVAFATILGVSSYQYKQMLPQLVIAAFLINFSRTIAGLFIDASQVVMLTFVNGFSAAAGGNFATMFQIQNLLAIDPGGIKGEEGYGGYKLVGGYLLALVMVLVALATTVVLMVILAFRIVMLWVLVVLSPLPYLLRILPKRAQQYGSQWWDEFFNYLIVGPVLAFFIWLALVTIGAGNTGGFEYVVKSADGEEAFNTIGTKAATPQALISYVIGICMLIGGLKIAGKMGVMGSEFANSVKGGIAKAGKSLAYKYSGARYVRERASGYLSAREAVRKSKVEKDVAAVQRGLGLAQQKVGAGIRRTVGGAGYLTGKVIFDRKAKEQEALAKTKRAAAQTARDNKDFTGAELADHEAAEAQKKGAKLRKYQARTERGVNLGVAGTFGALTGGLGAVGALTGIALAPIAFGKNVESMGKKIREKGQGYTSSKIADGRKDVKDLKPDEILKQAHEGNASAILEALDQQLIPPGELDAMEALLKKVSNGDGKTMQGFARTAEQKYFGTRNSSTKALARTDLDATKRTELAEERAVGRKRAIEGGLVNMRTLIPGELAVDDGELARDFVIHGSTDQRRELGRNKAHKDAYKQGVMNALAVETKPENKQKLAVELMRLGKGPKDSTGDEPTALENSGMSPVDFGAALKSPDAYQLVVNLDAARDLSKPGITDAIAQNLSAAQFRSARGAAARDADDTTKAKTIAAIETALKQSTNYKTYNSEQGKVRGAQDRVADLKHALNTASSPAEKTRIEDDLFIAKFELDRIAEAVQRTINTLMSAQEQELYESLKTKRQ